MGKVFHSCGHEDAYRPVSGWPLRVKTESICMEQGVVPAVEHSTVCRACYLDWVKYRPDQMIFEGWEEGEYFKESAYG